MASTILGLLLWALAVFAVWYWAEGRGQYGILWGAAALLLTPLLVGIVLGIWLKISQGYVFSKKTI